MNEARTGIQNLMSAHPRALGRVVKPTFLIITGILLAVSAAVIVRASDEDFSGSWSNQKDEFGTVAFSLRKDGKGRFESVTYADVLRWSNSPNGIVIHLPVTARAKLPGMEFTYDKVHKVLVSTNRGGIQRFVRVSDQEPPDYEAQAEQKYQEDIQKSKVLPTGVTEVTESFQTRENLLTGLVNMKPNPEETYSVFSQNQHSMFAFAYSSHSSSYICSLSLTIEARWNGRTNRLQSNNVPFEKPPPDLPVTYATDPSRLTRLTNFLAAQNVWTEFAAYESTGMWDIESYQRNLRIYCKPPNEGFTNVVSFLLRDFFATNNPPFELRYVKYLERKGK